MGEKLFAPKPASTVKIDTTTATASVALPADKGSVRVHNSGAVTVFITFGVGATVATVAAAMPIPAGAVETFDKGRADMVAAITASGAATIYFTPGEGA